MSQLEIAGEIPEANEGEKAERENAAEAMDLYGALSDGEIQVCASVARYVVLI